MRSLLILATAALLPAVASAAPARAPTPARVPLEGTEQVESLLLLGNDADVGAEAKILANRRRPASGLLDLAADVLWRACVKGRALDADTQAWLIRALGHSGDARYWNVLLDCEKKSPLDKVATEAGRTLDTLPEGAHKQFRGTSLDFDALRAQFAAAAAKDAAKRPSSMPLLPFGATLGETLDRLGLPDSVETHDGIVAAGYGKLGSVGFQPSRDKSGWELSRTEGAGVDAAAQLRDWLAAADSRETPRIARDLIGSAEYDRKMLDEVARRIWLDLDTADGHRVASLIWLCKVLATSADGRYREFLLDVHDFAESRKLASYAGSAAHRLPDGDPEPYIYRKTPNNRR